MNLNKENYFSPEAMREYWSVSQFKDYLYCEAGAQAKLEGKVQEEPSQALLVGAYVDAAFEGTLYRFQDEHPELFKKDGQLKAEYKQAEEIYWRLTRDKFFMKYMDGDRQAIMTGEVFGYPWKVKLDVLNDNFITDLKVMRDMQPCKSKYTRYYDGFGYMPFVEAWGYHIQAYIYQQVVLQNTGKLLPFYIACGTKEKVTDLAVIPIPDSVIREGGKIVEGYIDRFDMVKHGDIEPERCGQCDYCKSTKVLDGFTDYRSLGGQYE